MKVSVVKGDAPQRACAISRKTNETQIKADLCLDGGEIQVQTGIGFFNHMLHALAFYAGFGLSLNVQGDLEVDGHHTVEDTGIVLGQAFAQALGSKAGITRFASAYVPMDEALARTVLDISGRPFLVFDADMPQRVIGGYDSCLTEEFMRAFATHGGLTLHQHVLYGKNAHHMTEALFKSLGLCLKTAVFRQGDSVLSTKGML